MSELATAWGLTTAALIFAIPVLLFRIGDRKFQAFSSNSLLFAPSRTALTSFLHTDTEDEIVIDTNEPAIASTESIDMKKVESA